MESLIIGVVFYSFWRAGRWVYYGVLILRRKWRMREPHPDQSIKISEEARAAFQRLGEVMSGFGIKILEADTTTPVEIRMIERQREQEYVDAYIGYGIRTEEELRNIYRETAGMSDPDFPNSTANTLPPGPKEIEYKKQQIIDAAGQKFTVLPNITDQDYYELAHLKCNGIITLHEAVEMAFKIDSEAGTNEISDYFKMPRDARCIEYGERSVVGLGLMVSRSAGELYQYVYWGTRIVWYGQPGIISDLEWIEEVEPGLDWYMITVCFDTRVVTYDLRTPDVDRFNPYPAILDTRTKG